MERVLRDVVRSAHYGAKPELLDPKPKPEWVRRAEQRELPAKDFTKQTAPEV